MWPEYKLNKDFQTYDLLLHGLASNCYSHVFLSPPNQSTLRDLVSFWATELLPLHYYRFSVSFPEYKMNLICFEQRFVSLL